MIGRRAAWLLAIGLSACSAANDERICLKPPSSAITAAPAVPEPAFIEAENCIHRWGYRLAGSPDAPTVVATAVVGGCRDQIEAWAAQSYGAEYKSTGGHPQFASGETGQIVTAEVSIFEEARALAIFRVEQARAGHCTIPN